MLDMISVVQKSNHIQNKHKLKQTLLQSCLLPITGRLGLTFVSANRMDAYRYISTGEITHNEKEKR